MGDNKKMQQQNGTVQNTEDEAKNLAKGAKSTVKGAKSVANKGKDIGKLILKLAKNPIFRKILLYGVIITLIIIILSSALKMIFHYDTAGDGQTRARVPAAFQDITQGVGISTNIRSTNSGSNSNNSGARMIDSYTQSGDGYSSITQVGDKTYRNYKQYEGSYSQDPFWEHGEYEYNCISNSGCGPSSVAIVLSGYGIDMNPGDVVRAMKSHGHSDSTSFSYLTEVLNENGIETEEHCGGGSISDLNTIRENFNKNRPMIINAPNHYVAYLGEDENGNLIISDPGRADGNHARYGATLEDLLNSGNCYGYILITSDKMHSTSTGSNGYGTIDEQISRKLVMCAQACHKYLRENNYTYAQIGLEIPDGIYTHTQIDCSSYVSWVYYTAGYNTFKAHQEISFSSNYSHHNLKEVPISEAQPGDVILSSGHVELVAEVKNGSITRVYNCGYDGAIQAVGTTEVPESVTYSGGAIKIFRPKELSTSVNPIKGTDGFPGMISIAEDKMFFIGDSWMNGLKLSGKAKSSDSYFYAKGGENADWVLNNYSDMKSKMPNDVSCIIVGFGLNGRNNWAKTQELVDKLVNDYPNKNVFVLQTPHICDGYTVDPDFNTGVDKYNENMESYCSGKNGVTFINPNINIVSNNGQGYLKNEYAQDPNDLSQGGGKIHLNNNGYDVWYKDIASLIQNFASSGNSVSSNNGNSNGTGVQSSTNVSGHIVSNNRGGYKVDIDLDKKIDEIMTQLDDEGNNPLRNYLSNKNRKEYLKAFLRASIVTSYPDLRKKSEIGQEVPEDEVQGIIKIRRKTETTPDDNPGEYLQYIPENQYNQLKQRSDNSIFNYFTIDSSGQIVVAGYEKRTAQPQSESKGGDPRPDDVPNQAESNMYKITDARINYTQQVERYVMPFDLLWSLLVYSSDEDFTYDLAKLVTKGEIIITVCDNITQSDKTDVYTYDKNVKIKEYATFNDTTQSPPKVQSKNYSGDRPDEKYTYTITNKSYYESNNPSIDVTYADTWTMKYKAKVQKKNDTNTNTTNTTEPDDANFKDNGEENISQSGSDSLLSGWKREYQSLLDNAYSADIERRNEEIRQQQERRRQANNRQATSEETLQPIQPSYSISGLKLKYKEKCTNKKRKVTIVTTEKKYRVEPGKTEGKIDPKDKNGSFVKLLKEHDKAYSSLKSDKEWLFESMEAQESICDMEDLIKYLFQKTYNIDLGVDDFDFDEYGTAMINSVYGGDVGDILVHWVCSFENENLWDFMYENGEYNALYVNTHVTQDRKYYKMRADAGASTANNRNFGFGVCFYSNGNFMHTEAFRKYGIDITDSKYQQEASLLDTEIVDKVRDEKIRADVETLRERATREGVTLDDAQIAVLVDISYQWGNIGNFFDVYKAAGQDRKNTAIRNMQAYDNYGNLGGHPLDGVEYVNRENCRWKLFSEGIWVTNNGKTLTPNTTSSGSNTGNTTYSTSTTGEYGYDKIVKDPISKREYKVYRQGAYGGSIPSAGCSISSEAIVLSGYGINQTPQDRANAVSYFPRSIADIANDMTGLNVPSTAYVTFNSGESVMQEAIRNIGNNLREGKPVIILVRGSKYTSCAHYMALIGFNSQGKPVIADPAGGRVWEEDSLEDLVRYHIYVSSSYEQGYVLINKK